MAVREVITDPKTGHRTTKIVPGFEDQHQEEIKVKTKTKTAVKAPKVSTNGHKAKSAAPAPKSAFKAAIMALNGDNVYSKKSQQEIEDGEQMLATFKKWLNSGDTGEFIAIRRK